MQAPLTSRGCSQQDERGLTLVELALLLVFAVVTLLTLHSALLATLSTRQRTQVTDAVQSQGHEFLQRLLVIPFGSAADTPATGAQLDELFDADTDLGTATLRQVMVASTAPGHSFTTLRQGVRTRWRIKAHADLDGDGSLTGFREDRPDLLAIEIHADDRQVFRALRAADYVNTRRD